MPDRIKRQIRKKPRSSKNYKSHQYFHNDKLSLPPLFAFHGAIDVRTKIPRASATLTSQHANAALNSNYGLFDFF
jgi:hypothetical protein